MKRSVGEFDVTHEQGACAVCRRHGVFVLFVPRHGTSTQKVELLENGAKVRPIRADKRFVGLKCENLCVSVSMCWISWQNSHVQCLVSWSYFIQKEIDVSIHRRSSVKTTDLLNTVQMIL